MFNNQNNKKMKEKENGQNTDNPVILMNTLFTGTHVDEGNIGGEIINFYRSDNKNFYVYVRPHGTLHGDGRWDERIKTVVFIHTLGDGKFAILGKAVGLTQVVPPKTAHPRDSKIGKNVQIANCQSQYIQKNGVAYGGVSLEKLVEWAEYPVTFKARAIYRASKDLQLSSKIDLTSGKITNQSGKYYIEQSVNPTDFQTIEDIINDPNNWEIEPVGYVDTLKYTDIETFEDSDRRFIDKVIKNK